MAVRVGPLTSLLRVHSSPLARDRLRGRCYTDRRSLPFGGRRTERDLARYLECIDLRCTDSVTETRTHAVGCTLQWRPLKSCRAQRRDAGDCQCDRPDTASPRKIGTAHARYSDRYFGLQPL